MLIHGSQHPTPPPPPDHLTLLLLSSLSCKSDIFLVFIQYLHFVFQYVLLDSENCLTHSVEFSLELLTIKVLKRVTEFFLLLKRVSKFKCSTWSRSRGETSVNTNRCRFQSHRESARHDGKDAADFKTS